MSGNGRQWSHKDHVGRIRPFPAYHPIGNGVVTLGDGLNNDLMSAHEQLSSKR